MSQIDSLREAQKTAEVCFTPSRINSLLPLTHPIDLFSPYAHIKCSHITREEPFFSSFFLPLSFFLFCEIEKPFFKTPHLRKLVTTLAQQRGPPFVKSVWYEGCLFLYPRGVVVKSYLFSQLSSLSLSLWGSITHAENQGLYA